MIALVGRKKGLSNIEMLNKAKRELLYDESNCYNPELTTLRAMLELLKLKASHGWSDISFTELLSLLATSILPNSNSLPTNSYRAKKLVCPMSVSVTKIHACPNHCILYRKEYESI